VTREAPDLAISRISATPTLIAPAESINLAATVQNQGLLNSDAATSVRFYRSTDSTIDFNDTPLGSAGINVNALVANETSDVMSTSAASSDLGAYYYGACVSPVTGEADRGNNCSEAVKVLVGNWNEVANSDNIWRGRNGHTSVVFNDKMWVLGGYDGSRRNDVWSSYGGITWERVTGSAGADWDSRQRHTSLVFDGKMWVLGGWDGGFYKNDVWSSVNGDNWTEVKADNNVGWSARIQHTSLVFDDKMWVLGGYDDSRRNDVWSSANGSTWTQVKANNNVGWSARWDHTSVVFDDKMWVLGGTTGSGELNDVWSSENGEIWTRVKANDNTGWSGRSSHTSVVFDDRMWVLGGFNRNDVWSSTNGMTWTLGKNNDSNAWPARNSHTSLVFNKRMWVLGGSGSDNLNDVWNFSFAEANDRSDRNDSFGSALRLSYTNYVTNQYPTNLEAGEQDYYRVTLPTAGTYTFEIESSIDTHCTLFYGSTRNRLADDDNSGTGTNCLINIRQFVAEDYYILVRGASPSTTGAYTLLIR
jgi:hypothetical protein